MMKQMKTRPTLKQVSALRDAYVQSIGYYNRVAETWSVDGSNGVFWGDVLQANRSVETAFRAYLKADRVRSEWFY